MRAPAGDRRDLSGHGASSAARADRRRDDDENTIFET